MTPLGISYRDGELLTPTTHSGMPGAVDNLGNIVWICPVLPGTSADVKIWDKYGPQRTKGCFMEFEVGVHDGAYKGRLHSMSLSLVERL